MDEVNQSDVVYYDIDWDKVNTIKDIKTIIQTLSPDIVIDHGDKDDVEVYDNLKNVLSESDEQETTIPFISFCSQCKGRKHHLEQTLLNNLMCIEKYDNLEYVLLDFDSDDGLLEWIQSGLFKRYLDSGILKYYRVENQPLYLQSGTKNLSHRLSTGTNLINVDADNILVDRFIDVVMEIFTDEPDSYISANIVSGRYAGAFGRIGMSRELFDYIDGYDEIIKWWGSEDDDILVRLENLVETSDIQIRHVKISERVLTPPIEHSNELRLKFSPDYILNGDRDKINEGLDDTNTDGSFGIYEVINEEHVNRKYHLESIKEKLIHSREYGETFEVKQLINGELVDKGQI